MIYSFCNICLQICNKLKTHNVNSKYELESNNSLQLQQVNNETTIFIEELFLIYIQDNFVYNGHGYKLC